MDLSTLKELGIAGIAIGGFAYFSVLLLKQLAENRKDYTSFVIDNNHTNTELVRECTAMITEAKNAMENSNKTLENHNRVLERILEKL